MKPSKVQRGIQSRHVRSTGDAPKIGRVSRLRHPDGQMKMGWTSKRGAGGMQSAEQKQARRKVIMVWSVVLTAITVLVIGGFMMFWLRGHGRQVAAAADSPLLENVRIASRFASPEESVAIALVKRALANRDPALVEDCFRLGQAKPEEVIEFIKASEKEDGRVERLDWLSSMDVEGQLLEGVLVVYGGREKPGERIAFLLPDETGVWKVDFDAFARSSRPSWQDLLERRADHAEVRVFVARDSYHNGPFLDESRWVCYAMASPETRELLPDEHELLRGYCKAGSPQAKAMERIAGQESGLSRATLDIRRVEGADERQFEIHRVLSEDWVLTSKPFDERFD